MNTNTRARMLGYLANQFSDSVGGGAAGSYIAKYVGGEKPQKRKTISPDSFYNKKPKGKVAPKQIMPKEKKVLLGVSADPVNRLAGRAAMSKRGSKNLKTIRKKKTVPVPKKLRKQVKQILVGSKIKGSYTKSYQGFIGTVWTSSTLPTKDIIGYVSQNILLAPTTANGNNFTHWLMLVRYNGVLDSANYFAGSEFVYFSPAKILDAASILWNEKAPATDYSITTGNMTTRADATTGAVDLARNQNLKIMVRNSYVSFELKNTSQKALKISIKHCVPKVKIPTQTPLTAALQGVGNETISEGPLILGSNVALNEVTNPQLNFKTLKSFNAEYKYEEIIIDIKPGESCKHSLQGPKNYELDYAKLYNASGSSYDRAFYNQTTVAVVMSVLPDLSFATATNNAGTIADHAGRFIPKSQVSNGNTAVDHPVVLEIIEHFDLSMPEQTGFIMQATSAGTAQLLGQRAYRRAFFNGATSTDVDQGLAATAYDEEQPASGITTSRFQ